MISQLDSKFSWITASLGYWLESLDMKIRIQKYDPVSFAFRGYGMYMQGNDNSIAHSPYIKLAGNISNFNWQAGLKYFYYKEPASRGYVSLPPDFSLTRAVDLDRKSKEYGELLPTLGVSYHFCDFFEFYASYGRNQIRPYAYMPLINIYNQNRTKFQTAGITLDNLFDGYDMEISDNFDLGVRFRKDWVEIMPTVFYSKHKNLLTTVYDPRVDLSYYQNVGKATGYGFELETNFFFNNNLTIFLNPTYMVLTYDEDMSSQGYTLDTKGKQVVDVPRWSLKTGLIFGYKEIETVFMIRYLGERFGDAEHEERIEDYMVADLKVDYTKKKLVICPYLEDFLGV